MNVIRGCAWLFALGGLLPLVPGGHASPICCEGERGLPLLQQFGEAKIVILGHFENAKPAANGVDGGSSELVIERVYKDHEMIKGMTRITLPRYIADSKTKFIIFCDVYKGKIDAYKGTALVNEKEMLRYVDGAMKLKDRPPAERLRFAFDFLNSPEVEVAMDAYREYARSDYNDYKEMAKKLPAEKLGTWLEDSKTPTHRYGLYATLLGHCGNSKHAELIRAIIEDPEKRRGSGLNGLLMGYAMLERPKGWIYLKDLVRDREKPFLVRHAGLQTMRFLNDYRLDLVNPKDPAVAKEEIVKGVAAIMSVPDMADFSIEELRKWKRWDYCESIIKLFGQKDYGTPFVKKAILRYSLQCETERARAFVKEQRELNAEWVDDIRELLELETKPAPASK